MSIEETIKRFSPQQISVHFLYGTSVLILYITGLPIFFSEELSWIPTLLGGYEVTMILHRLAAIGMITSVSYYFVFSLVYAISIDSKVFTNILITKKDIKNSIEDIKNIFKGKSEEVSEEKYSYRQKLDVWIIAAEAVIFILTGLMLWKPTFFIGTFFKKEAMLSIRYIHGAFAILSLAGLLFHYMETHLSPSEYPLDKTIFTGKESTKELEET
ncbi:MAG: Formate dehydrogenase cytochrome b556 subunit [Candidatus Methanohalarchaeum thermophilum]|uniref:Formate dehydrogenase cytochrome b556 subunit n=1 Tax=Methanohalarchaeum thermophilum TaxID=1903181 RepID=A0A1Q6DW99_METT1|nr:MAG: Formate dehydrogenase cytochrome b556 subunit [Candidatus Methanohalarchaeum thermophilum]